MNKHFSWFAVAASLFAVGCGGNSVKTDHAPNIRAFDAIYGPTNVTVQFDKPGVSDQTVSFGQATPFTTVTQVNQRIAFVDPTTGATLTSADQSFLLTGHYYTVVGGLFGNGHYRSYIFENKTTNPTDGTCAYRVINTLPDPDKVDIYLVNVGGSIDGVTPTVDNLAPTGASKWLATGGGDYRFAVKDASSGQVFVDQTVTLPANSSVSLIVLPQSADQQQTAATLVIQPEQAG